MHIFPKCLAGKYLDDHLADIIMMMTAKLFQRINAFKKTVGSFFLADLKIQLIRRKHHIQVHTGKPQEAVGFPLKERTQKVWRRRNYTRPLPAPSRQFQSFLCNEIKWISLSTEAYVQYYEKAHCQWLTELCTLHVVCSDLLFFSLTEL